MPNLLALVHDGVLAASILYTATVTSTALTAVFARSPSQRRNAQTILKILLRRRDR